MFPTPLDQNLLLLGTLLLAGLFEAIGQDLWLAIKRVARRLIR